MKLFISILLGLFSALCAAALLLQGFLFPALPVWADLLLRIGTGIFAQILMLRISDRKLLQFSPTLVAALAALWGFFLLLTSPSWIGTSTKDFFQDYVSFLAGALLVLLFRLLRPWLKKTRKQLRRYIKRKRKQRKMKDIPHS